MKIFWKLTVILPLAVFFVVPQNANADTVYDNTTGGFLSTINIGYSDRIGMGSEFSTSTNFNLSSVTIFPEDLTAGAPYPRIRISVWLNDKGEDLTNLIGYTNYEDVTFSSFGYSPLTFYFENAVEIRHGYKYIILAELESVVSSPSGPYNTSLASVSSAAPNFNRYVLNESIFGQSDTIDFDETFNGQLGMIFNSGPSATGNYVVMTTPCNADSRTLPTAKCEGTYASSTFDVGGVVNTVDTNMKLEILFRDVDGNVKDSISYVYPTPSTITFDHTFSWSLSSTTYQVQACLVPSESSSYFGFGDCVTVLWGNGATPFDPFGLWTSDTGEENTYTQETAWLENGCDDIGITDVFKGVKCAFIWGFAPTQNSLDKFSQARTLAMSVVPVGYATIIISDLASSTQSTSTAYFDRDINFGRWFGVEGLASTTIETEALLEYIDMGSTLFDMIDVLLWLGFVAWLLIFGLTRKL